VDANDGDKADAVNRGFDDIDALIGDLPANADRFSGSFNPATHTLVVENGMIVGVEPI
jgi:hypothetical protein